MKAHDIDRSLYSGLVNLDKDDFIYSITYELAIRAAVDDLIEYTGFLSVTEDKKFFIDHEKFNTLDKKLHILEEYHDEWGEGETEIGFIALLSFINNKLMMKYGLDIKNGYWEYHFIPEKTKNLLNALDAITTNEKVIYGHQHSKKVDYDKDGFSRIELTIHKGDEPQDIKYQYYPKYTRPRLFPMFVQNKEAMMFIDLNLPTDILKFQVNKLLEKILHDRVNVLSSAEIYMETIGQDYDRIMVEPYKQKGQLIDMLLSYDYDQIRRKEIDSENKQRNKSTPRTPYSIIFNELAYKLNIAQETARKYIVGTKKLLKDNNYFMLLYGQSN